MIPTRDKYSNKRPESHCISQSLPQSPLLFLRNSSLHKSLLRAKLPSLSVRPLPWNHPSSVGRSLSPRGFKGLWPWIIHKPFFDSERLEKSEIGQCWFCGSCPFNLKLENKVSYLWDSFLRCLRFVDMYEPHPECPEVGCPMFIQGDRSISLSMSILQKVAKASSQPRQGEPVTLLSRGAFLIITSRMAEGIYWTVSSLQGIVLGARFSIHSVQWDCSFKNYHSENGSCELTGHHKKVKWTTTEGPLSWKGLSPLDKPCRSPLQIQSPRREARQTTSQEPGYWAKSFRSNANRMLNQNVKYKIYKPQLIKMLCKPEKHTQGYWMLFCTRYARWVGRNFSLGSFSDLISSVYREKIF